MSNLFKLDWKDVLNGILFAVMGDVVVYLLIIFGSLKEMIMNNQPFIIDIDLNSLIVIASFSGLTYLFKRFFSGPSCVVLSSK